MLEPVLFPIPDEAPVITRVLPSRRFAIAVAIVRLAISEEKGVRRMNAGLEAGRFRELEKDKKWRQIDIERI